MAARGDSFEPFDETLASTPLTDPWVHALGESPVYAPDYAAFERLLAIPLSSDKGWQSGGLANGVDSWLAHELRRAGFGADEVWPRASRPRIVPRDIAALLELLPKDLSSEIRRRLTGGGFASIVPTDARILGRAYEKQVDVAIARWDRGPELMLSTKTMVSSFGKNLANRFEEAYGDAGNLRGRYPLAAVGFFFLQRSTILDDEPDAFEKTVDMMRKLRDLGGANGYTATGLALVNHATDGAVRIELERIPADVRPEQFLIKMIEQVLAATPVAHHVDVRSKMERRNIPVAEEDNADPSDR
ncbi:hypothetical protein GCM10010988_39030 [Cnuibacter physcomitrellae]|uniref:Uncharacterized protein n=1 Tax=Cnuibacter physcomitrellae TaxID=1619308 RepID=A0A1X9LTA8_9MICO|nr:hypothetical protein [Cnuibacter physcomitrellae]ARJ07558.1 hypothetical protein B5808_19360 [Cnuibacter physcomitrellae]GGI42438.1 hypothetical protein GCM10010988_39030 [Cnuibacter physcomitrellae]